VSCVAYLTSLSFVLLWPPGAESPQVGCGTPLNTIPESAMVQYAVVQSAVVRSALVRSAMVKAVIRNRVLHQSAVVDGGSAVRVVRHQVADPLSRTVTSRGTSCATIASP
jgi:hypothetical protein